MRRIATILTAQRSRFLAEGLTYDAGDFALEPGMLVSVPLRNKEEIGLVLSTESLPNQTELPHKLKPIAAILSETPLLPPALLRTMVWMSKYYLCSLRKTLSIFLPNDWEKLLPKEQRGFVLSSDEPVRSPQQQAVVQHLREHGWTAQAELLEATGASMNVIRGLLKKEVINEEKRREELSNQASTERTQHASTPLLILSKNPTREEQRKLELIDACIQSGKQAIILCPTQEAADRRHTQLAALYPHQVECIHGDLTLATRRHTWRSIREGNARIVVGTRAALFAPCSELGLILIEHEHDWSYKSEQDPRYHARNAAEVLAQLSGASLVLCSASPSLESWQCVQEQRFDLETITRTDTYVAPRILNLQETNFGDVYPLTYPLIEALQDRLQKKEQSVLLLNRKGMATGLLCLDCKYRPRSPETQIPLTVRSDTQGKPVLYDTATKKIEPIPSVCPSCQSPRLHAVGAGTESLETMLRTHVPSARVVRLDSLQQGETVPSFDILIGTQRVLPLLQQQNVTLLAVVVADIGLSIPHFRAGERVVQSLAHAQRIAKEQRCQLFVQTFQPDCPEIAWMKHGNIESYLASELAVRNTFGYPPAVPLIQLQTFGEHWQEASVHTQQILQQAIERSKLKIRLSSEEKPYNRTSTITLRGIHARRILSSALPANLRVDVDPLRLG